MGEGGTTEIRRRTHDTAARTDLGLTSPPSVCLVSHISIGFYAFLQLCMGCLHLCKPGRVWMGRNGESCRKHVRKSAGPWRLRRFELRRQWRISCISLLEVSVGPRGVSSRRPPVHATRQDYVSSFFSSLLGIQRSERQETESKSQTRARGGAPLVARTGLGIRAVANQTPQATYPEAALGN